MTPAAARITTTRITVRRTVFFLLSISMISHLFSYLYIRNIVLFFPIKVKLVVYYEHLISASETKHAFSVNVHLDT